MKTVSNSLPKIKVVFEPNHEGNQTILKSSRDSFELFSRIFDQKTIHLYEEFKVLYLKRNNQCIGYRNLSRGSCCGTVVDIQLVVAIALECRAQAIILCHNHPSGNLSPSTQDRQITKTIMSACKYFEIKLLDHLIISSSCYLSFADERWI